MSDDGETSARLANWRMLAPRLEREFETIAGTLPKAFSPTALQKRREEFVEYVEIGHRLGWDHAMAEASSRMLGGFALSGIVGALFGGLVAWMVLTP